MQEGFTLNIKDVYLWHVEEKYKFIFLFNHSLELVLLLWVIIDVFKLGLLWFAFAIGVTEHLLLDIFFNQAMVYSYTYLFSYRLIKGFKKDLLIRPIVLES